MVVMVAVVDEYGNMHFLHWYIGGYSFIFLLVVLQILTAWKAGGQILGKDQGRSGKGKITVLFGPFAPFRRTGVITFGCRAEVGLGSD
jgi:hypothetical protein